MLWYLCVRVCVSVCLCLCLCTYRNGCNCCVLAPFEVKIGTRMSYWMLLTHAKRFCELLFLSRFLKKHLFSQIFYAFLKCVIFTKHYHSFVCNCVTYDRIQLKSFAEDVKYNYLTEYVHSNAPWHLCRGFFFENMKFSLYSNDSPIRSKCIFLRLILEPSKLVIKHLNAFHYHRLAPFSEFDSIFWDLRFSWSRPHTLQAT